MKTIQVKSLGHTSNYSVAADAAEYDQLAKRAGACVDSANSNTVYRSVLNVARYNFLHGVEGLGVLGDENYKAAIPGIEGITGIERLTKETGKFKGEGDAKEAVLVFSETESDYYDRVLATLVKNQSLITIGDASVGPFASVEAARSAFNGLYQQHLDAIPFDPSETEKAEKGPKKTPKVYLETAKKLIAAGKGETAAAKLSGILGITVEATEESLARAIAEDQRRQKEKLEETYS